MVSENRSTAIATVKLSEKMSEKIQHERESAATDSGKGKVFSVRYGAL